MSATVKLLAGSMNATTGELTANSLAASIDYLLAQAIPYGANEDPRARRQFIVAIAQGVVTHLQNNAAAITVQVPNVGGTTIAKSATIDVW